jgi:hypothetical protein
MCHFTGRSTRFGSTSSTPSISGSSSPADHQYLIIEPDNADVAVEDYKTFEVAAKRAASIIRDYEPDWPAADIIARLKAGTALSYHDHSEIRIEKVS